MSRRDNLRPLIWAIIRRLHARGEPVTAPAVRGMLRGRVAIDRIGEYLRALAKAGVLTPAGSQKGAWTLVRDTGSEAPRVRPDGSLVAIDTAQQAIWTAARVLNTCSAAEVQATASSPARPIALVTVRDYLDRLARAGLLHRIAPGLFHAPRTAGPLAPLIRRDKSVHDPNTGRTIAPGAKPAAEVAP